MSHTAVLFAGGYSHRMGRDKAGLTWGDRRLLEHQADTLRATDPQELILSCRPEQPFALPDFVRVDDGEPGAGALVALAGLWVLHPAEVLLVLAVDMPLIPATWLRALAHLAENEGRAVVPRRASGYEPLAAAWHLSCLPELRAAQLSGQRSFQALCTRLEAAGNLREISAENFPPEWLTNLNTPEDLPASRYE
ncbi:molybdenum cofactor guanylyltransferase [Opitutus sp. GAS368]|uniref:molybdenum cofactor guanylyltransferase n=1 Tax=Opitutus sp. GAS368 TaxID=1882749 RepID=UPI00087B53AB|nr:molybdenum cofactor guanylyltransferase [Opitutus sp. GAS368]SDS17896.1 molybdenum cofactor guanylyltransferase [Opitutus sp. GAS368]